jgi:S1-C subfamily serine protease
MEMWFGVLKPAPSMSGPMNTQGSESLSFYGRVDMNIGNFLKIVLLHVFFLMAVPAGAQDLADTISTVKNSVVGVGTFMSLRNPQAQLLGTGFAVGDGRYVVTNKHVIADVHYEEQMEIAVFSGHGMNSKMHIATSVASDPVHDLALLRITSGTLPALKLGDSEHVREGELYAFTGFPIGAALGLYPVTHRGIISAITPIATPANESGQLSPEMIARLRAPYFVFQLDATAYPGNSGSPLYSVDSGAVIGVINMVFIKETKENILNKPSGISYAIPSKYIVDLLKSAKVNKRESGL